MSLADSLVLTPRGEREILITRDFDAPRELVWDALHRCDLLRRWLLGPPGWTMTVCENDVRPGGAFRHVWRDAQGAEMAMSGTYLEVVRPERVVRSERFLFGCDAQAGEQHGTLVLTERDGRTTITITVLYPSREARDGALQSGMEHGMRASYARCDDLLAGADARP
ncbi:MAG: SRPBCC family protein [Planctomycetes bacterium]|nr:SRPBCC family protein [Planctomycetota bacterium]